ncbi:AraC-like DNA-binding protein [Mesorhizobium soli]|uniref:AraC family transcriptional regulator n=1 Tax=Pseudaminobacter soli (ex Li et al. 2025) TaxID=1295366 RepID=UPI002475F162|nr:AraC family transcriptional regulator [Mesorhizobium soli]MDH6231571.1 AraC-like DNA-binding protein [Mesorhizobium soli]
MHAIVDAQHGFAFGEASYQSGGMFGPLTKSYVCLVMVHEGAARITCDDTVVRLEAGQCGIFRNERFYLAEYERGRRDRVTWCEASPAILPESVALRLRDLPARVAISERIEALQRFGLELGTGSGTSLNMLRNALGQSLFMAFFHEAHMLEAGLDVPRPVLLAKQHIDENFNQPISVGSLAHSIAMTPQHLIVLFRRYVGETPIRYLWQKRAEHGHFLLLHTGLTISDIAYRCGYKNPFHFSRQIKLHFGKSPREVRLNRGFRVPADEVENAVDTVYQAESEECEGRIARSVAAVSRLQV